MVEVPGGEAAIFRVDGDLHAIDNVCPHRGASLAFGDLKGSTVFCPLHAWGFDVRTGRCDEFPHACVRAYRVHLEGEYVQLEL